MTALHTGSSLPLKSDSLDSALGKGSVAGHFSIVGIPCTMHTCQWPGMWYRTGQSQEMDEVGECHGHLSPIFASPPPPPPLSCLCDLLLRMIHEKAWPFTYYKTRMCRIEWPLCGKHEDVAVHCHVAHKHKSYKSGNKEGKRNLFLML